MPLLSCKYVYLEYLAFVIIRDVLVLDADDLLIGKEAAVFLGQYLFLRTFPATDILVPKFLVGKPKKDQRKNSVVSEHKFTHGSLSAPDDILYDKLHIRGVGIQDLRQIYKSNISTWTLCTWKSTYQAIHES